jgi:hypothetical protein
MRKFRLLLGLAALLVLGGSAWAKHATHPVTPQNIDKQPFAFTVEVKDVDGLKEVRVTVRQQAGHPAPVASAYGRVGLRRPQAAAPAITRVQTDDAQTYTFRLSPADFDGAYFVFTETPDDPRVPFPYPGDYWTLNLKDFVPARKK